MRLHNSILPWLILAVWVALVILGVRLVQQAPAVSMVARIVITLPPSESVDLGRQSLGMPDYDRSVASAHLRVRRDAQGAWHIANIAAHRKVDVRTDQVATRFLRRWPLAVGDRIRLQKQEIRVITADPVAGLTLATEEGEQVRWQAGHLRSNRQTTYPYCRYADNFLGYLAADLRQRAVAFRWDYRQWHTQQALSLFSLGGQVQCPNRWALAEIPLQTVQIYWRDGRFWLGATATSVALIRKGAKKWQHLATQSLALIGPEGQVNRLILGRTWFHVKVGPSLLLTPMHNQPVAFGSIGERPLPKGVELHWRAASWMGEGDWHWPSFTEGLLGAGLILLAAIFTLFVQAVQRAQGQRSSFIKLWLAAFPAWGLLWLTTITWGSLLVDLGWALGVCAGAWLLALLPLWRQGRLTGKAGLVVLLGMMLAGFGALTLTQLAVGAANSKWLAYASGHLRMLTLIAALIALAAWLPGVAYRNLLSRFFANRGINRWLKLFAGGAVGWLLIVQFVLGDEQGLGWLQPVELAKFVVIFLLAATITHLRWLRRTDSKDYRHNRRQRILAAFAAAGAFVFGSAVVMLGVHDNSPLVIVFVTALPFVWLAIADPWLPSTSRTWLLRGLLVVLPLFLLLAGGTWLWYHPPDYLSAIPQADRFRVWSDPWAHHLSGQQLLISLQQVAAGGWTGVSSWFGVNGPVMSLPAVQDDFIAAFFLNHFGGLAGMVLIVLQVLWCGLLLHLGLGLMRKVGDRVDERGCYWLGGLLFGLAWMQMAHWLISWANVLGLLPVMGQPMTWFSSGNSHMLALAVSSLLLAMVAAWLLEDKMSHYE